MSKTPQVFITAVVILLAAVVYTMFAAVVYTIALHVQEEQAAPRVIQNELRFIKKAGICFAYMQNRNSISIPYTGLEEVRCSDEVLDEIAKQ